MRDSEKESKFGLTLEAVQHLTKTLCGYDATVNSGNLSVAHALTTLLLYYKLSLKQLTLHKTEKFFSLLFPVDFNCS